jgi:nucleoside-diphosphate-sugar epimerase
VSAADLGRVLVTGGGGFLGTALARRLRERGLDVRSLSRRRYQTLDELGVEQVAGDVGDAEVVDRATEGCGLVFHTAAKASIWGAEPEYERINVGGTRNVIAACRKFAVRRLIFTSSPSVVFNGKDMQGADESVPYTVRYEAAYPKTKARAEQLIIEANGAELATTSLRPHLIWGPGDNNLLPRIIARAESGRLKRIGHANPLIDPIYIDNAVDAHLLAADRLEPGAVIAGKIYFVTQGETIPLWDMINAMLKAAGKPGVTKSIATPVAFTAAGLLEAVYWLTAREDEPPMTRFLARQLTTSHWFKNDAARRDLGYEPRVSFAEGFERLKAWCDREAAANRG